MNVLVHITADNPERDFMSMAWEGFDPLYAMQMQDFTSQLYRDPDLIGLLHCHLPYIAPAIVREIRQADVTNRLFVTLPERGGSKGASQDRAFALRAGADDVQPAHIAEAELVARLKALATRGEYNDHLHVALPNCTFDLDRGGFVQNSGRVVKLSPTLSKLMAAFARRPYWTLSVPKLMDMLYSDRADEPRMNTIHILISMLRRKMRAATGGLECIHNDWGRGYRFEPRNPFRPSRKIPARWRAK